MAELLFPAREASGTSWQPDAAPMRAVQRRAGGWTFMVHGAVFLQFLYEPGEIHRTGGFSTHQLGSVNWEMIAARRPLGAGRVGLRVMASAEPWTLRDCGSLNLLATGEYCEGDTIHDRQHPHDLWMEIAADYDRPIRGTLRWQVYGGLSGEPALGPTAFPHRASAAPNPMAPITHHWLDSTHIAFGLVTTGIYDARWKAEVSVFNGREPDEHRANLDLGPLDSVAGRFSLMPTRDLAVQVSAGYLRETEYEFPPQPRTSLFRLTSSASYHHAGDRGRELDASAAFGLNSGDEVIPGDVFRATTAAFLVEGALTLRERAAIFTRGELVWKPAHDLHAHEYATEIFPMGKLQAGYVRDLPAWKSLSTGIGGYAAVAILPPELAPRYGGTFAPEFGVFVTVRPGRHQPMTMARP